MDNGAKHLYTETQVSAIRKRIMNDINAESSLGINIKSESTMIADIDDWLFNAYKIRGKKLNIDTETLNNDIANGGRLSKLFGHFESVGEDYMRTIGMVGELNR